MSLKRKASFPTIAPLDWVQDTVQQMVLDDSPKHLNCRTRKRVRNDRPEEHIVYERTLRWLFTAQQRQQQVPTPPADDDQNMDTEPLVKTVDPRQQSLLKFFRPIQPSFPLPQPRQPKQLPENSQQADERVLQYDTVGGIASPDATERATISPALRVLDGDTDMDLDSGNDESAQESKQWVGGFGWL